MWRGDMISFAPKGGHRGFEASFRGRSFAAVIVVSPDLHSVYSLDWKPQLPSVRGCLGMCE